MWASGDPISVPKYGRKQMHRSHGVLTDTIAPALTDDYMRDGDGFGYLGPNGADRVTPILVALSMPIRNRSTISCSDSEIGSRTVWEARRTEIHP